jgi:glycine dehydrogenase subunit 1
MPTYTPHSEADVEAMLGFLGLERLDQLFEAIPESLRLKAPLALLAGRPEPDVLGYLGGLAAMNRPVRNPQVGSADDRSLVCFAGGGAYDRYVAPVVQALASRPEFVTSYTPYQPELSQGVLQALFEFQSMVAALAGLDVANASLYDGAAALAEAVWLAAAWAGRGVVWVSRGCNPSWRQVLCTLVAGRGIEVLEAPLVGGTTTFDELVAKVQEGRAPQPAALVVASPNYLGCLEPLPVYRQLADRLGALFVVAFDPVAVGVVRSPGEEGADVAVAEGQSLGLPLGFGGPYLGIFACRAEHARRLPGRLVGETTDLDGRRAYVTTLRAREQDIRRERATSNVCTNQTLMAIAAAIQLAWLGPSGLAEVARRSARGLRYLKQALVRLDGVEPLVEAPQLFEAAFALPIDAERLVERLLDEGFLAGIPLDEEYAGPKRHALLVAVTERRTRQEIDEFVLAVEKALR